MELAIGGAYIQGLKGSPIRGGAQKNQNRGCFFKREKTRRRCGIGEAIRVLLARRGGGGSGEKSSKCLKGIIDSVYENAPEGGQLECGNKNAQCVWARWGAGEEVGGLS